MHRFQWLKVLLNRQLQPVLTMEEGTATIAETNLVHHLAPQPIMDETPIDEPQILPQMVHNQDNHSNLGPPTNDQIVLKNIASAPINEVLIPNGPPTTLNTVHPSSDSPTETAHASSTTPNPPIFYSMPKDNTNSIPDNDTNDNDVSHTVLNTTNSHGKSHSTSIPSKPIENHTKSTQETDETLQPTNTLPDQNTNPKSSECSPDIADMMDVDEKVHEDNPIALSSPQIETENINSNSNNDPGIGTEPQIQTQKQDKANDKEEMDIDEPEPPVTITATDTTNNACNANLNLQNIQNLKEPTHNKPNNHNNIIPIDNGYDEEQDEDFNADEEEEEDDESGEHSEDIAGDDDESDYLYSELADIDIVCDSKIYTEEAPRWITFTEDGTEFNVENAYQNWEHDKQQFGTIYSDGEDGDDDMNDNNNNEDNGADFFTTLLNKYGAKQREDPEKDKIQKKGGDYKLDDAFIDDGDCFEQNGAETVFEGFFIARGHIDIKNPKKKSKPKPNKKPPADIPKTYQIEIEKIKNALHAHSEVLVHLRKQRYMKGVISNKEMYLKFGGLNMEEETKQVEVEENMIEIYRSLLVMLLDFDTMLLREKPSSAVKQAIYVALASEFEYDTGESFRKQQQNFEDLLNWFSYDWYDDTDDVMRGKKMNWRILFLDIFKNRAKARFHNKLNKVRKETISKAEKTNKSGTYKPADIPWDLIVSDIFLMTCYAMESAAVLGNDMDDAAHECHMQLRDSISKYLEGGANDIAMSDIETRYNEQTKKAFTHPSYCYSYLVVQRIKEMKRKTKKPRKTPKKTPKKAKSTPQPKKPVVDVDLTYSENSIDRNGSNENTNNAASTVSSPPSLLTPSQVPSNIEPQSSAISFGINNDVIDLTGNEGNAMPITNSETIDAITMSNAPKTEQKSLAHSRKRKRSQIEDELTQNPTQDSNSIESKSRSPPNKRRKLTEKAEYNAVQPQTENDIKSRCKELNIIPGSLIAVQESDSLHHGATICIVESVSDEGVHYRYYATGSLSTHCAPLHFCYFIEEYPISDPKNAVLALKLNDNGLYEGMFVLANVMQKPQHRNDVIGVKYLHNHKEIQMPLRTPLKSDAYMEPLIIPTVIPVIPVYAKIKTDKNKKSHETVNIKKKKNVYTNGNDNTNSKPIHKGEPPSSDSFYCNLPVDPWNDVHFAGQDTYT
eukprot:783066_1